MTKKPQTPLAKTIAELCSVHEQLVGRRVSIDRRGLIIVPFGSGLWARCESLTFQAFTQIRCKRDWMKARPVCIKTEKTLFLWKTIDLRYKKKEKPRVAS